MRQAEDLLRRAEGQRADLAATAEQSAREADELRRRVSELEQQLATAALGGEGGAAGASVRAAGRRRRRAVERWNGTGGSLAGRRRGRVWT